MIDALSPTQLGDEGQAAYQKGDYQSAARLFQAAADGFSSTADELSAAEMANNCSVALLKAGDAKGAFEAVQGTETVFALAGDTLRQGMAIGNQGAALDKLNRIEDAAAAYERSAELLKQAGEAELRAYVLQSLSALQLRSGHQLEAYATMLAGVKGIKKPNLQQKVIKALMEIPFKFLNGPG
jgi:tetratricopeptide (TPR) repeat protein